MRQGMRILATLCLLAGLATLASAQLPRKGGLNPWTPEQVWCNGLSGYYGVSADVLVVIRDHGIRDDEMPLLLLVARRAHTGPDAIAQLRRSGKPWREITRMYGVGADDLYVNVGSGFGQGGPRPLGLLHTYSRDRWGEIPFEDEDLLYLANLRYLSERHGMSPGEVAKMHMNGRGFTSLDHELTSRKNPEGETKRKYSFEGR